jgi:SPP1 family predicted phage head-tail adaptor
MERFNVEITIQQDTGTGKDSYGQHIEDWTAFLTTPAAMFTTGGRELYAAQKVNAETSAVFKLWYVPEITPLMRIKYGCRIFNILSVNNENEQNRFLLISAKEVV